MSNEFFSLPNGGSLVMVDSVKLCAAEQRVFSCESCNFANAFFPFNNVLDEVTGSDPSVTDYELDRPARCPACGGEILVNTCVEWYALVWDLSRPISEEDHPNSSEKSNGFTEIE